MTFDDNTDREVLAKEVREHQGREYVEGAWPDGPTGGWGWVCQCGESLRPVDYIPAGVPVIEVWHSRHRADRLAAVLPSLGWVKANALPISRDNEPPVGTWVMDRHGATSMRQREGWAQPGFYPGGEWHAMWDARGPYVVCPPWGIAPDTTKEPEKNLRASDMNRPATDSIR